MRERGTWFIPTLSTSQAYRERIGTGFYAPQVEAKAKQRLAELGKSLAIARRIGVKIAFGTDAGVYRHGVNAKEFALMVEYGGLTPRESDYLNCSIIASEPSTPPRAISSAVACRTARTLQVNLIAMPAYG